MKHIPAASAVALVASRIIGRSTRRHRFAVLVAGICVAAHGSGPAYAGCDLTGTWKARQANGYTVTFKFTQTGRELSGTARTTGQGGTGDLDGYFVGDVFEPGRGDVRWRVYWPNGAVGNYQVGVDSRRRVSGTTWPDNARSVEFHFLKRIPCD